MNYKNITKAAATLLASFSLITGCIQQEFEEVTVLSLSRCLEPQNLSAQVDAATGDNVTFNWSVNKDAESFNLIVCTDSAMTVEALNDTIAAADVPYTVRLAADTKYFYKVQALAEGRESSNWARFDGSFKTYAVKDNLFPEITARTATSVSLSWSSKPEDYTEVTHITATPVQGGDAVKYTLTAAEAAAAAATVSGLAASTEYQIVLYYMSASRGALDAWTLADPGTFTTISTSADLKTAAAAGGSYYLAYSGSPYSMGSVKPAAGLTLIGELSADGTRPVVTGSIALDNLNDAAQNLYFEGITFSGSNDNSRIIDQTAGTSPTLGSIKFVNCGITEYKCGLFYDGNNDAIATIGEFSFDTCDIYGILGSGGDCFDVRKSIDLTTLKFVNNTIYDGMRTFFRIDANDNIKIGSIVFENNTVKNICTMNDGNNRGIFAIRVKTSMSLKNNIFLWEDGGLAEADKAQLFQDNANTVVPELSASNNYSYAEGVSFFTKVSAADAGIKELNEDPCYNSKGGFFQLSNQTLISNKAGASKWWISYVEQEEDLSQSAVKGAHTWNLQDATLFAGEVKNSRVRDSLLLVGTEATPMNADGAINFLGASVLTRKGVPTEGYIAFKVTTAGSVDLLLADGGASSVVVALQDDGGFNVIGGAMATSNAGVQKVVIPAVSGEGMVYIYATGAISIQKLAWSLDTLAGNKVLATPKPVAEPVTLTEGDATPVTITWEPVDNAAGYEVTFNKRNLGSQTELSYTVPAEDIAALKAGLYGFTVQAFPLEDDIYYVKSELGSASVAIQPKASAGETVEVDLVWDFSGSDWQTAFAAVGAANTDITGWDITIDGLQYYSNAKSKYQPTYIQMGGAGSTSDRYLKFTAPEQGTLKVTASGTNTTARAVYVQVGEDIQKADPCVSTTALEYEFSVAAGDVYIYGGDGALRFYKIHYNN